MYLRTTKRHNADGTTVCYYQIAENVWDTHRRCAVAKVIYNFGRADQLDLNKLQRLADSILRVLGSPSQATAAPAETPSSGVRIRDAWPYGAIYVLEHLWKQVGVDAELNRCARQQRIKQPFERALFAMVANRALSPYSKLY